MLTINGKQYPLWSQFIEKKEEYIGGILQERDAGWVETIITDIVLKPNGEDSAYFEVRGKGFGCGFDVKYGGIVRGEEGWRTFDGYGGHTWRIRKNDTS